MKPSAVFGVAVRILGVLAWLSALLHIGRGIYVLIGLSDWVNTANHAAFDDFLPAIGLIGVGFVLLRGAFWLTLFAYPKETYGNS